MRRDVAGDPYVRERENMVSKQLARRDITDRRVLDAMRRVPRHQFVRPGDLARAYGDHPIPIGESQTISQPYMVALMTQCLKLTGVERVLEIGTGSGYQTAVLAELSAGVHTVERIESLSLRAQSALSELGYTNVSFRMGDGTEGWPEEAPYSRIIVTAGAPRVPQPLVDQLGDQGILVIPVGDQFSQRLRLITKRGRELDERDECGCVFVKLIGQQGWPVS